MMSTATHTPDALAVARDEQRARWQAYRAHALAACRDCDRNDCETERQLDDAARVADFAVMRARRLTA